MKHKKIYAKILASTLAGSMLISNVGTVFASTPKNEEITKVVNSLIEAKSEKELAEITRTGEDLMTFTFDNYRGGKELNLPLEADNVKDKAFKIYGFIPNVNYAEAISLKEKNEDKSLQLITHQITTDSALKVDTDLLETLEKSTTRSAIQVDVSSAKLDCAMEKVDLRENIALDFDVMFEDSYSEKALFKGKYRDSLDKVNWYTPSEVSIKKDNKLYIGKEKVVDLLPHKWYNLKIAFDLKSPKKTVTYCLDDKKIYEVSLKDNTQALETIKFLQIADSDDSLSKTYIDNYKIYPCEIKRENVQDEQPNLLLFEDKIQDFISCDSDSKLELSKEHTKFGDTSLKWNINGEGELYFDTPIGYEKFAGSMSDQRRESFVVYLYNEKPSSEKLTFEFQEKGERKTGFDMGLDFKGWRSIWVMFDRDMDGTPSEGMDNLTINAPSGMEGSSLYFSSMILSTPLDARHHTCTPDVPFVNKEADNKANSHWMSLNAFYEKYKAFTMQGNVTQKALEDLEVINDRFKEYLYENRKPVDFNSLVKSYDSYKIKVQDGQISGRSIDYKQAFAILDGFDKPYYLQKFDSINSKDYMKVLYDMAIFYNTATNEGEKNKAQEMFINMFWHLYDQGFSAGSSVGTVHHLGYEIRDYFPAVYLMKNELRKTGWLKEAQESMGWFSGLGKIFYEDLKADGVNADVLNTLLESMLSSILTIDDEKEQAEMLREYTKWLTFACSPKPGLKGPFKYDGLGFHHAGFYPAYTRDGLKGLTPVVYLLRGTEYRLPKEQHELVKKAVMNFRLFSNRDQFLISVSGRHPKGTEKFPTTLFKYMALAGNPEGTEEVDQEVAAAYLRLTDKETDPLAMEFKKMGIQKEKAPNGNWAMNYAALGLHRRDEWLVGVRGHSRYLWGNETYQNANLYGRYMTHGQIQIMSQGSPVNNEASGYKQQGWDWNSWPGTTTVHLPVDELKSDVRNVDTFSGFEEMLISDETYAGGLDLEGQNGMFAMKLHEHPKYEGSHRARKSVFMFDDTVIALGSDIENTDSNHPTCTTLFQSYLQDTKDPIFVNNTEEIQGLGYNKQLQEENISYIVDNNKNGYLVPQGQSMTITRETQISRDQQKGTKTEGNFAKALIEHGKAPKNAEYEYMIVVDTTPEKMQQIQARAQEDKEGIYSVLQKDTKAHIVKDKATGIVGYALFEADDSINKGNIVGIDTPALVMSKEENEKITLSVCDPDLRLYEGVDESQYDAEGNRKEVSIYSRKWMNNESKEHTLHLSIKGTWKLEESNKNCKVFGYEKGNTILAVSCKEAAKVEMNLEKTEAPKEDTSTHNVGKKHKTTKKENTTSNTEIKNEVKKITTMTLNLSDIKEHWAKKDIEEVVGKGLMVGKSKTLFKPNDFITRAEGAVILDRILKLPTDTLNTPLSDVKEESWYGKSIYRLLSRGIIKGYKDGTYKPHKHISRMEILSLLARGLKNEVGYKSVENVDKILEVCKEKVPVWAKDDMAWCIVNNLISYEEIQDLSLKETMTRADMAILLNQLVNKNVNEE